MRQGGDATMEHSSSGILAGRTGDHDEILARRVTMEEFLNYMAGKLEYIQGRMVTGSGIELFVGVEEFAESIKALEAERMLEDEAAIAAGQMRMPKDPGDLEKLLKEPSGRNLGQVVTRALLDNRSGL